MNTYADKSIWPADLLRAKHLWYTQTDILHMSQVSINSITLVFQMNPVDYKYTVQTLQDWVWMQMVWWCRSIRHFDVLEGFKMVMKCVFKWVCVNIFVPLLSYLIIILNSFWNFFELCYVRVTLERIPLSLIVHNSASTTYLQTASSLRNN